MKFVLLTVSKCKLLSVNNRAVFQAPIEEDLLILDNNDSYFLHLIEFSFEIF